VPCHLSLDQREFITEATTLTTALGSERKKIGSNLISGDFIGKSTILTTALGNERIRGRCLAIFRETTGAKEIKTKLGSNLISRKNIATGILTTALGSERIRRMCLAIFLGTTGAKERKKKIGSNLISGESIIAAATILIIALSLFSGHQEPTSLLHHRHCDCSHPMYLAADLEDSSCVAK